MIIIFDLDDTLYEEITFVKGGFKAVAKYMEQEYKLNQNLVVKELNYLLQKKGRGKVFDEFLKNHNIYSNKLLRKSISIYRYHPPDIKLTQQTISILEKLSNFPLYLVTDGNKNVQYNKILKLNIKKYFKKTFITHRFGIHNAKPSLYCFKLIKKLEDCNWRDLVYIGDNPLKDFVSLNRVGAKSVRILKGNHSYRIAKKGYDANITIKSLIELPNALNTLFK